MQNINLKGASDDDERTQLIPHEEEEERPVDPESDEEMAKLKDRIDEEFDLEYNRT